MPSASSSTFLARTRVSGSLPAGDMTFDERQPLRGPRRRRGEFEASYAVVDAQGTGVRFLLDDVDVTFAGCTWTDCEFVGKRSWHAAGAFGHVSARTVYRDCRFVGVDFGLRGFTLGWARFERCTFEACRLDHLYAVRADLVGCRFVGPVADAQFIGADPATGVPNEISDNDFTAAVIGRASFQAGARADKQRWSDDAAHDQRDDETVVTTPR